MTSLNRLGTMVAIITALILAVIFAGWWAVRTYWLEADQNTPVLVEQEGSSLAQGEPGELTQTQGDLPVGSQVIDESTWTGKYLASLPDGTSQDQILSEESLREFVNANKDELLPDLPEGLVKTSAASGPQAVEAYLDQISPTSNTNLSTISIPEIGAAWRLAYQNNQPEALNALIQKLHNNVDVLEAVAAPQEVAALHTRLLAASHALTNNAELLRDANNDWVGALIAARNIDDLSVVFQELQAEIGRLREQG